MSASATKFIIVRHGETDWNIEGRLQGQSTIDPGLNEKGFLQAETLAEGLKTYNISKIFSSDLRRARETALKISILLNKEVSYDKRLRERNQGVLHNLTYKESEEQQPEAYAILKKRDVNARIPNGESQEDIRLRVVEALQDIGRISPGAVVLIVTHGGVVHEIFRHVKCHMFSERIINGSVNILHLDKENGVSSALSINHSNDINGSEKVHDTINSGNITKEKWIWAIELWNSTTHLESVGFSVKGYGGGAGEA
eukprot:CAMPEP_0175040466 /NCGR_PEP_ID=MMETSP0052_2-20121109/1281_1 /TAXON_ID=51329 ORGANISM="Polytomella parva, Strain SAG 63-3" /NCGR_SAMPLE_ID=MMETSP0052_2 /ASSEMBLY_ACC=CAM_ASM_000194 /LENGTH=254 /DNA_ID=CAMNT_0016302685 /DNA_START=140 /DNA_END=904 /DNA_ORIENTATION=+